MLQLIKNLFKQEGLDYESLMKKGAKIIDVRTPAEFAGGHVEGSVNIPLGDIQNHIVKLKRDNKPVITCCRSGARSGRAKTMLKNAGIEVYNGGSWGQVQEHWPSLWGGI